MTREEILAEVRRSLVEMFGLDPEEVTPAARLFEDLDLDSIDAIDMAVKIQEVTGRRVEEAELRNVRTVGDVVLLIDGMLAGRAAKGS